MAGARRPMHEHACRQMTGDFSQWVARPRRAFDQVVKTAATLVERNGISLDEMRSLVHDVCTGSVEPFFQAAWGTGHERLDRYNKLVDALAAKGLI